MPIAHYPRVFPEPTSAAMAEGPTFLSPGSRALLCKLQILLPQGLEGQSEQQAGGLPLPAKLTPRLLFVIRNCLGNIFGCDCSQL